MQVEQRSWNASAGWEVAAASAVRDPGLVLVFGSSAVLRDTACLADLRRAYPDAPLFGCSTAGEICGVRVSDETLVATAIRFEQTTVRQALARVAHPRDSFAAGRQVAEKLADEQLTHVLVLSDGLHVNGTELVRGISEALPPSVSVTGGLAADGARFEHTWVLVDGVPKTEAVTAVGFYGNRLHIGYASQGGWDPFGPERLVTRSEGNVLYELDGKSALDLYKRYLGDHSNELPASGLLFPLSLRTPRSDTRVVRTILSVNEADGSMSFAGDIPSGAYAQLMKANFDRLVDGAIGAARSSVKGSGALSPDLAILVSCVGRKLVLKQRIEEEIEGVRDVMGKRTVLAGFYSYGEISPFTRGGRVELHNQTMTITAVSER